MKIFWPRPPNTCLPMTMANTLPRAAIQTGRAGGRHKANKSPVSTALPSAMVAGLFMILMLIHSAAQAPITLAAITINARRPKKYMPAIAAGRQAKVTSSMARLVVYTL